MKKRKVYKVIENEETRIEERMSVTASDRQRKWKKESKRSLNREMRYGKELEFKESLEELDKLLEEGRLTDEEKDYSQIQRTTFKAKLEEERETEIVHLDRRIIRELKEIERLHGTGSIENTISELISFYNFEYFQLLIAKIRRLYEEGIDPVRLAELSVLYTLLETIDEKIGGLTFR